MKKLLLICSFACIPMLGIQAKPIKNTNSTKAVKVYICTGPYSKVYHSSPYCRGLNRCSGEVKSITLKAAMQMGRRSCKICYQ